jgi:cytochrome c551/c552
MLKIRRHTCIAALFAATTCVGYAQSPAAAKAFTEKYCEDCHDDTMLTAGVSFQSIDWNNPGKSAATLEKAIRKLGAGEMPPVGMPQPPIAVRNGMKDWLVDSLDKYAAVHPNAGRPAIHRLNRSEYSNAVRDLLALKTDPGAMLPVDDSGYGFDNVADVLSVSPTLLDRYLTVAKRVSKLAVGDLTIKPSDEEFQNPIKGAAKQRVSDDLPFGSEGGMSVNYYFPVDAEYVIHVKVAGGGRGAAAGGADGPAPSTEIRLPVKAGWRTVGATFPEDSSKAELTAAPGGRRGGAAAAAFGGGGRGGGQPEGKLDLRLDGARLKVFAVPGGGTTVGGILISGPYNITGRGDTPSREKIFVCRPKTAAEESTCAHTIMAKLTRRAFRRNVTEADIKPLMAFYDRGRAEGDFDHGIERALTAMLVSPDFLFRVERDPAKAAAGTNYRITDVALASRLSFFLWSTIPDDQLLDLAEANKLHDPLVLQAQVQRMLDDPKSQALVDNFAGQWLFLRNLQLQKPDPVLFPEFDETLREDFKTETALLFQNIFREDRSILELITAKYDFLNQRLADHYGIAGVYGPQFRKVDLTDPERGGLLGQGSILTVTSYPNRTSVVQRGKWILENLLGVPPPPPPPDVNTNLDPHGKDGTQLSLRQQMERHRADPVCSSCHSRMDPIGFALENYDAVGKWRDKDGPNVIDPSGKTPDGTLFNGPVGLKQLLVTKDRDMFVTTATTKLLLYALGRGVEYYDEPAVRNIMRDAAKQDYRMSALINAIVKSTPFQMRRTPDE